MFALVVVCVNDMRVKKERGGNVVASCCDVQQSGASLCEDSGGQVATMSRRGNQM